MKGRLGIALISAAFLLLCCALPRDIARAEEEGLNLPLLLVNGSIYARDFNPEDLPPAFRGSSGTDAFSLYLVQFEGPVRETWLEELGARGAQVRGYVPYNAVLAGMDGEALSRVKGLGPVAWTGPYHPYFKLSPALQLRLFQGGRVKVLAELSGAGYVEEVARAAQIGGFQVLGAEADEWGAVVALELPVKGLRDIAALPGVEWMELCGEGTVAGAVFPTGAEAGVSARGEAEAARATSLEVTPRALGGTTDELVGLSDTGFGKGGLEGLPPDLRGRVRFLSSRRGDDGADVGGHGTAAAGVLCAGGTLGEGGSFSTSPEIIAQATSYGLGCPPLPLSIYSLLEEAHEKGAAIHVCGSVPEGSESLGLYGIHASRRDAFAWSHPRFLLVEAAGNGGTDADADGVVDQGSLLGGATAKNVLSVGGCEGNAAGEVPAARYSDLEGVFPGRFPAPPLKGDGCVDGPTGMAAFSARGPTSDGRIKPDLVAPATGLLTLSYGGELSARGLWPTGNQLYAWAYGTGMAAAAVGGGLARMRAQARAWLGREPSAALLKAFAVNNAVDLYPGQYGSERPEVPRAPNCVEGWGRFAAERFYDRGSWLKVVDDEEGLRTGEARVFRIEVEGGTELRVTLAWTDYPSLPAARLHLVNDLDLRVIGPEGDVFYPNGRDSRDPLNNVERVTLDVSGKPGLYTVEVTAWNVPFAPQPYALVIQ